MDTPSHRGAEIPVSSTSRRRYGPNPLPQPVRRHSFPRSDCSIWLPDHLLSSCPQYSSHGAPPRAHIDRSACNATSCHQIYCVNIQPSKSVAEIPTRKIRCKINAKLLAILVATTRLTIQSRKSMGLATRTDLATSTDLATKTNLAMHARTRDVGSTRNPQPIKQSRCHASDTA